MTNNTDMSALVGVANGGLSIGIDKLAELIKNAISKARTPTQDIPPFLTTIESKFRPGLSAISLTSSIVSRLGEAGIDSGTTADGTEPLLTRFVRVIVEEMIKELQLNMKTFVEIPSGTLMGQAGTVPVVSTAPIQGSAIII